MWDEITYLFPNFNGATFDNGYNSLFMLGLKLNRVSKMVREENSCQMAFSTALFE